MKIIAIVFASFCLAGAALAQSAAGPGAAAGADCKTGAGSLHGAALNSKVRSCCQQQAAKQKLHGAAETSFRKSCESAGLGA
ncbi:MAG TPA: hypothetical protein VFA80_14595 [Xanthobacteraceae bacterium]|jgi:hypothetical protein|nr:hypothetical protein [Xanthobacteraceae bacterium]